MISRRRVLSILAGTAALPLVGPAASAQTTQWRGIALGADARIILDHPQAQSLIDRAVKEIERLEQIFSLYRPDSQISVLNRDGVLPNPSFELIELLSICSALNARTQGAFDPTIQALWSLYARKYAAGMRPGADDIAKARKRVGWRHVVFSPDRISFRRPGVALTLNGIAQGFIADRVTDLLRANGILNVLVNTGEIAALGVAPDGRPWPVKLGDSAGPTVGLSNAAIATSAPLGTVFDAAGTSGHIIDPRTGIPHGNWSTVSVMSPTAAEADGLSTAFCLMSKDKIAAAKGASRVWFGHRQI